MRAIQHGETESAGVRVGAPGPGSSAFRGRVRMYPTSVRIPRIRCFPWSRRIKQPEFFNAKADDCVTCAFSFRVSGRRVTTTCSWKIAAEYTKITANLIMGKFNRVFDTRTLQVNYLS